MLHKNIDIVWRSLTKYSNYKIVLVDGKTTRNMKSFAEMQKKSLVKSNLVNLIKEKSEGCLTQSGKALHPTVFSPKTGLGAVFTTKNQEKQNDMLIEKREESRCYAQIIDTKNKFIEKNKIEKEEIKEMLDDRGYFNLIIGHKITLDDKSKVIVINEGKKQKFININNEIKDKSNKFIEECGGKDKIEIALDFHQYYIDNIEHARKIILNAVNDGNIDKKEAKKVSESLYKLLDMEITKDMRKTIETTINVLEKL